MWKLHLLSQLSYLRRGKTTRRMPSKDATMSYNNDRLTMTKPRWLVGPPVWYIPQSNTFVFCPQWREPIYPRGVLFEVPDLVSATQQFHQQPLTCILFDGIRDTALTDYQEHLTNYFNVSLSSIRCSFSPISIATCARTIGAVCSRNEAHHPSGIQRMFPSSPLLQFLGVGTMRRQPTRIHTE
jgi:hypothetical protein